VTYEAAPEGLVYYAGDPDQTKTLREGETWTGDYGFVNISDASFIDGLSYRYAIRNIGDGSSRVDTLTIAPPSPGDTTIFTVSIPTTGSVGIHDVEVVVNPHQQPEMFFDNNRFSMSGRLVVERETFNPVIDATVDGRHIEKDEYVSASPTIRIALWDENDIMLAVDTTQLEILFSGPCTDGECAFRRLWFADALYWRPGSDDEMFSAVFKLDGLGEGRYVMQIKARDLSGNTSGADPLQLSFTIEHEQRVELSDLFPNPATHEINLDILLTGDVVMEDLLIEIINLRGEVAASFNILQMFHNGNNRVRVPIGDESNLPAGLYLYRITGKAKNNPIKQTGKISVLR
jgi:hypothetical protein